MNTIANSDHPCIEEAPSGKENTAQKKIYLRSEKVFVDVTDEVYYAYYRPIWKIFKRAQRNGECNCPQSKRWKCDGECYDCPYHCFPDTLSDATPIGDGEDLSIADLIFSDNLNPEELVITRDFRAALNKEVNEFKPLDKSIYHYLLIGKTEKEIAALLSRKQQTISYHRKKIADELKVKLKDYLKDYLN